MRKMSWILIMLMLVSFSGRLVIDNHAAAEACAKKTVQKKNASKQEEDALGTMMLLPISFNMEVNNTSN
ncbi:MAG: hypothetical protein HYR66_14525 [Sphingobacteriales bacterium]|nr:hypothetical protein [Sphingobacteriales bacterium]MBI3719312.1 hypothetical protein [Sphingobacteriales bacterium]